MSKELETENVSSSSKKKNETPISSSSSSSSSAIPKKKEKKKKGFVDPSEEVTKKPAMRTLADVYNRIKVN